MANSVNESKSRPLTKKEIAEAVGCAPSLLSRGRFKSMPPMYSVDEYKAWEVSTRMRGTSKFEGQVGSVQYSGKWEHPGQSGGADRGPAGADGGQQNGQIISVDWRRFETTAENHLDVTLNRGMHISNMAYALLHEAVERGDIAATFGAIKNWSAALREESDVREKLLKQQMDQRSVIALDEVKHVLGMIIQEIVAEMEAVPSRGATRANPENPQLAQDVYQEEFDRLKMRVQAALSRIESELSSPDEEAERQQSEEAESHGGVTEEGVEACEG